MSNKLEGVADELAAERARVRQLQAELARCIRARDTAAQCKAGARQELHACTVALQQQRQETAKQAARADALSREMASREFGPGFGDSEFLQHKVTTPPPLQQYALATQLTTVDARSSTKRKTRCEG